MKMVNPAADVPSNAEPPISACIYHRCLEHRDVRQINDSEGEGGECGACIGEQVAFLENTLLDVLDILAARLLASSMRKDHLQRCIGLLNFLEPGAGDRMVKELADDWGRTTIRRQMIDVKYSTADERQRIRQYPDDHPIRAMLQFVEEQEQKEQTDGRHAVGEGRGIQAVGGEAVRGEQEEDPGGGSA